MSDRNCEACNSQVHNMGAIIRELREENANPRLLIGLLRREVNSIVDQVNATARIVPLPTFPTIGETEELGAQLAISVTK